ncbi:dTDP-4-dehydrorhamnose 3,5-epimerase family protein [Candidatus Uhrbacteria bacterium]|nr:dTDP-4-dehydrorhamnose 3,5-epimerase family protein [Candidatus Uhrbacteria bacterium]
MEEPRLIEGGIGVDDRGEVGFVNNFDFAGVKRFYTIRNHKQGFVRAWHAHRNAGKYVLVVSGSAIIGAVGIDNWERPDKNARVHRFIVSAHKPAVVWIPPGYANGAMSLASDTVIMYFATDTLDQTKNDDVRYDARYWDIWNVEER